MTGLLTRLAARGAASLSICALVGALVVTTPTQVKASEWLAVAVGAAMLGIVLGGGAKAPKKPEYKVIARLCENPKTGLYHKC
ncbi:hypothetical protein [Natronohydrobacter thiooxidans]|uniref:hypothetical protein n=1 Tax=Natronohydrobacter thiooxidans TaxID=87172 RepID=UPI0008FF2281|nr:hypothetical protein [Natronohydrobacter thiooxidans]